MPKYIFHGGCHGCTRQEVEEEGVDFCIKCCYFDANWDLPNLNNEPPSPAEKKRIELKLKYHPFRKGRMETAQGTYNRGFEMGKSEGKQEGRREVVEWIEGKYLYGKHGGLTQNAVLEADLKLKCKEWGIDA